MYVAEILMLSRGTKDSSDVDYLLKDEYITYKTITQSSKYKKSLEELKESEVESNDK